MSKTSAIGGIQDNLQSLVFSMLLAFSTGSSEFLIPHLSVFRDVVAGKWPYWNAWKCHSGGWFRLSCGFWYFRLSWAIMSAQEKNQRMYHLVSSWSAPQDRCICRNIPNHASAVKWTGLSLNFVLNSWNSVPLPSGKQVGYCGIGWWLANMSNFW